MQSDCSQYYEIVKSVISELASFEEFLKIIGFKRTDGAIFGLMVLSPAPLSSEEIGTALGLSQAAVSQGLKSLTHWGAVVSRYSPERRVHLHTVPQDSLSIAATVFQKREQGAIEAFRRANERARDQLLAGGEDPESPRLQRIESNITTCEFAQVIIAFSVQLSRLGLGQRRYAKVVRALPRALNALTSAPKVAGELRRAIVDKIKERAPWH